MLLSSSFLMPILLSIFIWISFFSSNFIGKSYLEIVSFISFLIFSNFSLNNSFVNCLNNKHFSKKSVLLRDNIIKSLIESFFNLNLLIKKYKSFFVNNLFLSVKLSSLSFKLIVCLLYCISIGKI